MRDVVIGKKEVESQRAGCREPDEDHKEDLRGNGKPALFAQEQIERDQEQREIIRPHCIPEEHRQDHGEQSCSLSAGRSLRVFHQPQGQRCEQDQEEAVAPFAHAGPDIAAGHQIHRQKDSGVESFPDARPHQNDKKKAGQYGQDHIAVVNEVVGCDACREGYDKIGQIGEDVVRPIGEVRRSRLVVAGHSAGRKLIPQKDHDAVVADLVVPGRIPGIQLPHG